MNCRDQTVRVLKKNALFAKEPPEMDFKMRSRQTSFQQQGDRRTNRLCLNWSGSAVCRRGRPKGLGAFAKRLLDGEDGLIRKPFGRIGLYGCLGNPKTKQTDTVGDTLRFQSAIRCFSIETIRMPSIHLQPGNSVTGHILHPTVNVYIGIGANSTVHCRPRKYSPDW